MSGEKRLENYLAKGKVKIEATLKDYIIKKKKSMMEGRNFKIAFAREERFFKTERTWGTVC